MRLRVFRRFGLQDILFVQRLQNDGIILDLRRALLWPHTSLTAALLASLPINQVGAETYVLKVREEGLDLAGLVQVRLRRERPEGDIVGLAPSLARVADRTLGQTIWHRLLGDVSARMGARGVQRLFIRLAAASAEVEVCRQAGFGVCAREHIYRLTAKPASARTGLWRVQRDEDLWGVQQLYNSVTPRPIQQAEGMPKYPWDGPYRTWTGRPCEQRYVWHERDSVVGALRIIVGHDACWMQLMFHPDLVERADEFVVGAVALLPPSVLPVYCDVREYQPGAAGALERHGFELMATQLVLVKHTTARVIEPVLKPLPALEKGVEATPSTSHSRGA